MPSTRTWIPFRLLPIRYWVFGRRRGTDRYAHRVSGCVETRKSCTGLRQRWHTPCHFCGAMTCQRTLRVDESGRRRRLPTCMRCRAADSKVVRRDWERRGRRTRFDWTRPIPDQYPSLSRSILREFIASGEPERVLSDIPVTMAGTINESIATLGFDGECYAEQRSQTLVLRRSAP